MDMHEPVSDFPRNSYLQIKAAPVFFLFLYSLYSCFLPTATARQDKRHIFHVHVFTSQHSLLKKCDYGLFILVSKRIAHLINP
jgi:hypothetical protein